VEHLSRRQSVDKCVVGRLGLPCGEWVYGCAKQVLGGLVSGFHELDASLGAFHLQETEIIDRLEGGLGGHQHLEQLSYCLKQEELQALKRRQTENHDPQPV